MEYEPAPDDRSAPDDRPAFERPWTAPYRRAELAPQRTGYEFHDRANRRRQVELLQQLLAVEAPVSVDYAVRRLADAWGLRRRGARVSQAGHEIVRQVLFRGEYEERDGFLWARGHEI